LTEAIETFKHILAEHVCITCDASDPCPDCPVKISGLDYVSNSETQQSLNFAKHWREVKKADAFTERAIVEGIAEASAEASAQGKAYASALELALASSTLADRIRAEAMQIGRAYAFVQAKPSPLRAWPGAIHYVQPKTEVLPDPEPIANDCNVPKARSGLSAIGLLRQATKLKR
jgi:hypothetical protein